MMKNNQEDFYICPSFNSYSSGKLAEIAVRVAVENSNDAVVNEDNDGNEDFEFALVREDDEAVAEEFLYGGQSRGIFPVFNRDLLLDAKGLESSSAEVENLRIPLSKVFVDNREEHEQERDPPSCSSSETDELDSIHPGTFCIWRSKAVDQSPSPSPIWCKKSKSTGSASKRWKFPDLLRRSNSEGKDSFVFLTPKHREEKSQKLIESTPKKTKGKGANSVSSGAPGSPSAHEVLYVWNRTVKEGNKKKSYLPYRQDLVGFFANVNGLSRTTFPHF